VFGYAVVNFPEPADAMRAIVALAGVDEDRTVVEWSQSMQGTEALVEKYRNSAVLHEVEEAHRPLLFHLGVPVAFPNPSHQKAPVPEELPKRPSPHGSCRSTLIVRGLSRSATVEEFIELLDQSGFVARYDFVHIPRNISKGTTLGYAVLNLASEELATAALTEISSGALAAAGSFTAEWSEAYAGLEDLINKYRNNKVMKAGIPESYRPQVLFNGKCVPYPGL
jgi:hypothetical protein